MMVGSPRAEVPVGVVMHRMYTLQTEMFTVLLLLLLLPPVPL